MEPPIGAEPAYAGFWVRFGAAAIDLVLVGAIAIVIFLALALVVGSMADPLVGLVGGSIAVLVAAWLYFAALESRPAGATLGKRVLRLGVRSAAGGGRVSFARTSVRWLARWLSLAPVLLGYLIQPATRRKQALHDLVAGTVVVSTGRPSGAGIAAAVLATTLVAGFGFAVPVMVQSAFGDYTVRARVSEALLLAASPARTAVQEHLLSENRLPSSLEELGVAFEPRPGFARGLDYDRQTGTLTITLDMAPLQSKTLQLTPERVGPDEVRWKCRPGGIPRKYLPTMCRE